jgi:hypothetical protein
VCNLETLALRSGAGFEHLAVDERPPGIGQWIATGGCLLWPRIMNDSTENLDATGPNGKLTAVDETCRRAHTRLAGPFEARRIGRLETRVTLYDLSRGGAFVNSMYEQQEGTTLTLRIDLPDAGEITVRALTLYRRSGGYAVRFLEMTEENASRFDGALRVLQDHGY